LDEMMRNVLRCWNTCCKGVHNDTLFISQCYSIFCGMSISCVPFYICRSDKLTFTYIGNQNIKAFWSARQFQVQRSKIWTML